MPKINDNPYYFDTDENDVFPIFTQKNLDLVGALIRYNSDYSAAIDVNHPEYKDTYAGILTDKKDAFFDFKKDNGEALKKVIISIDKINHTHLKSEGPKAKSHDGINKTAKKIMDMDDLVQRLKNGNPDVVNEIASAVKGKNNFSFASKFCAYVSELALGNKDKYCKYDKVVQEILPLYIYHYVGEEKARKNCKIIRKSGNIESAISRFRKNKDYDGYKKIIDDIINGIKEKDRIAVTYSQLDHLLWYYFKGSKEKRQNALNKMKFEK